METITELVAHANKARSTGSTGVNEESSRSHSIMQAKSLPHKILRSIAVSMGCGFFTMLQGCASS